jgi:hypothetical protein
MTDKYQGRYMTATQLLLLVNQSVPGNYPVVRVMPENRKHFADFTDAIEHFDYIDNQMLAFVTSAKEKMAVSNSLSMQHLLNCTIKNLNGHNFTPVTTATKC